MNPSKKVIDLLCDNYQFLITDEISNDDLSEIWDDQSTYEKLAITRSTVAIGTQTNYMLEVQVELRSNEPTIDKDQWEHITECSFFLPSGNLCFSSVTDYPFGPPLYVLEPGCYRILSLHSQLIPVHLNLDDIPENCRIIIWQSEYKEKKIIKQWNPDEYKEE